MFLGAVTLPAGTVSAQSTDSSSTPLLGAERTYNVINSGSSYYNLDGYEQPAITLVRGETYTFDVDASGHPFHISTDPNGGDFSGIYTDGVTVTNPSDANPNAAETGTLTFTVSNNAPDTLYYQCGNHSGMGATITIIDAGDGSAANPFVITNASELQAINIDLSASYVLGNNIDASSIANFDPIGDPSGNQFTGTFNGSNYTISGLYINRSTMDLVGLFAHIGSEGVVENIALENADIIGKNQVGGLVGYNLGTVSNSYATGSVTGSTMAAGGRARVNLGGSVTDSYATVDVTGDQYVGGLVGANTDAVTTSYAIGSVTGDQYVGGLVGYNEGTVDASYAIGTVTGTTNVGGFVGDNPGTVTDAYWDVNTTGQETSAGSATGLTTSNLKGDAAMTNTALEFTSTWGVLDNGTHVSYPYLQTNPQQPEPGLIQLPSLTGVSATNPSGQNIVISFDSDVQLSSISVSLSGPETATFNSAEFTGTDNGGSYTYTTTYVGSSDGTYTVSVDTATDSEGNNGANGESDDVTIDTTAPVISSFSVTNPSGQDVQVRFDSDERLGTIGISISGAESGSLSTANFTETDNGGSYTYTTTYVGSNDGTYTVALETAIDRNGNDGANGESDSATSSSGSPSLPTEVSINPSGDSLTGQSGTGSADGLTDRQTVGLRNVNRGTPVNIDFAPTTDDEQPLTNPDTQLAPRTVGLDGLDIMFMQNGDYALNVSSRDVDVFTQTGDDPDATATTDLSTDVLDEESKRFVIETTQRPIGFITVETNFDSRLTVQEATHRFHVQKSYFAATGTTPASVTLSRDEPEGWRSLPTRQTGEDETSYYFEADTPGFSVFAIGSSSPIFEVGTASLESFDETTGAVTATVPVENIGSASGAFEATLTADGTVVATQTVTVGVNETADVSVAGTIETFESVTLRLAGQSIDTVTHLSEEPSTPESDDDTADASAEVADEAASTQAEDDDASTQVDTGGVATDVDEEGSSSLGVPGIGLSLMVALGLLLSFIVWRRRANEKEEE
jgi:PGF-pre-PGF domain-containing protein